MYTNTISDVRVTLANLLAAKKFTSVNREATMTALTGGSTIEITGASFRADSEMIFGQVNYDYVKREEEWYNSQSLNVNDIPGGAPQVWKAVADKEGFINSNYGWCVYSPDNGGFRGWDFSEPIKDGKPSPSCQYAEAVKELKKNPESRRAEMIYNRPSMWRDYNKNGRSDFMCTNAVQYLVRDGQVNAVVQMRSNDAILGYRNDWQWQRHVLEKVAVDLNLPAGNITWQASSLHVYARHFYLVHHFSETGELTITKEEYNARYPDSPYCQP
jgi:thymidylate synthase